MMEERESRIGGWGLGAAVASGFWGLWKGVALLRGVELRTTRASEKGAGPLATRNSHSHTHAPGGSHLPALSGSLPNLTSTSGPLSCGWLGSSQDWTLPACQLPCSCIGSSCLSFHPPLSPSITPSLLFSIGPTLSVTCWLGDCGFPIPKVNIIQDMLSRSNHRNTPPTPPHAEKCRGTNWSQVHIPGQTDPE